MIFFSRSRKRWCSNFLTSCRFQGQEWSFNLMTIRESKKETFSWQSRTLNPGFLSRGYKSYKVVRKDVDFSSRANMSDGLHAATCVRCMTPLWLWCMSVISNDDWMTRVNTWKTWTPRLREAIKASDRGHSVHRSTISPSHCAPLYFLCVCVCVLPGLFVCLCMSSHAHSTEARGLSCGAGFTS